MTYTVTKTNNQQAATATGFQTFWDRYGKKRERGDAERAWLRLTEQEQLAAINGITAYQKRCQQQGGDVPYPAAYLNQRLWQKPKGRPPKYQKKVAETVTTAGDQFYGMDLW